MQSRTDLKTLLIISVFFVAKACNTAVQIIFKREIEMKMPVSRVSQILSCILLCIFITLTKSNIQMAQAQPVHTPKELPGWPIELSKRSTSQVVVSDINGDGRDELILTTINKLNILNERGENLPGWPREITQDGAYEPFRISVGDIDGDGNNEVVCAADKRSGIRHGFIWAFHFESGADVVGWPVDLGDIHEMDMVLGNFDDNPLDLEIAVGFVYTFGGDELTVHVLDGDGTVLNGWPQSVDINFLSQVYLSAGNIDNLDSDEIVIACHKTTYYQSPIYVFHSNGQLASGWPIQGNGPFVSPAVLCNLDGDNDHEVVAATVNAGHAGRIYAWKPNGTTVSGWPAPYNAFDLSVGDLDSDDQPEIIASYSNNDYWADHLAVINRHGTKLLSKQLIVRTAATLGNADYDTDSEIIIPSWDGDLHVMDIDGQNLAGFPVNMRPEIQGYQSALGDLDGDGDIEIVQLDPSTDQIHAFDLKALKAQRPDWPMVRHDGRRSSFWTPPQTPGFDILEITGPLQVLERSSTQYTARAYFEDGSNKDVTLQADWWVAPAYTDYAHFESGGILITNPLSVYIDIIIYAEYTEGDYTETASYNVRIRPTIQILRVDDDAVNDPGPKNPDISDPDEHGTEQHPFDTIQEAISVSGDGDTVIVLPGVYNENVDFEGKDIILTSVDPNYPPIVAATVITSGSSGGTVIRASDGSLLGFTVSGGISIGSWGDGTAYSPIIRNCRITSIYMTIQVTVPPDQGPVYPVIENNVIKSGSTGIYMDIRWGGYPIIRNNTIIGEGSGAGIIYRTCGEIPTVTGNIIVNWNFGVKFVYDCYQEERKALITYNNVWGNTYNYWLEEGDIPFDMAGIQGNISQDPLFVDFANGDYHLKLMSPCINAGDPAGNYLGFTDIDGQPRIVYGRSDIGADEYVKVYYVDADAKGNNNGTSWTDAYNYLQDALARALYVDEIWVAEGIYKPDQRRGIAGGNREATFQLINGVPVKGGYAGFGEPDPNARDIKLYETILSGDIAGNDGEVHDPCDLLNDPCRAENSYHVVTGSDCDESALLDGFTITGGNSNGSKAHGGGMYNYEGSPTLSNCIFRDNSAGLYGGGIYNRQESSQTVTNCIFIKNWAFVGGGMVNRTYSDPALTNCIFSGNVAEFGGGLYSWEWCSPRLTNCTFTGNTAEDGGGMCDYGGSPTVNNCIFWDNSDADGMNESAQVLQQVGQLTINYTCIQGWTGALGGTGNIGDNPCFLDAGYWGLRNDPNIVAEPNDPNAIWIDGDYHLLLSSPCIDAGDPNYVTQPDETDFDGKPRVIGGRIDMGAYEFQNTPPVADAGPDQIIECECNTAEGTKVALDGSASYDADGDPLSFTWTGPFIASPAHGAAPTVTLEPGCPDDYVITLVVDDGTEDSEPDEITITVVDTTPPEFELSVSPTMLWPPDHKMYEITPSLTVSDECDASPQVSIVGIVANEGNDTVGDGHTTGDIDIGEDGSIYLRSERSGKSSDRVYTITYQAVDDSGNTTVRSATVSIPHDFKVLARIAAKWL